MSKNIFDYINDKEALINHAEIVLNSGIKGKKLAEMTGIHYQQIYAYRNKRRDIKKARLENLLKLNNVYFTHENFEKERKEDKNGWIKRIGFRNDY